MFFKAAVCLGLLALSACVNRSDFSVAAPMEGLALQRVYVGTNRIFEEQSGFGTERGDLAFASMQVSIPSDRKPGQVPWQFGALDPSRHFAMTERRQMPVSGWRASVRDDLARLPKAQRGVVVYVHGFNNTFNDGVFRLAQLMEDLKISGVAAHFSWPSAGNPLGYAYDRDSVLFARDDLETFLTELNRAGAEEILLLAHSMGSLLVVETLRQMSLKEKDLPIGGVVLISPDIDQDVFLKQAEMIRELPQPFALFVSERDRALSLAARLTGQKTRLGNLNNVQDLGELPVTVVDISAFDDLGIGNHMGPLASPTLLGLLRQARDLGASFDRDRSGRAGLLPGTIITFQNATEIILSPVSNL